MLGGLAVDPRYRGVLLIGLYNFSSTPFPLRPGSKLIGAVFYELANDELAEFEIADPTEITDFPDELIMLIRNYKPVELKGIQDEIAQYKADVQELKKSIDSDKTWRDEFKRDLSNLLEGLKEERDARKEADKDIREKFDKVSNTFAGLRVIWIIAALVVGGAIEGLGSYFIPKLFDHGSTAAQPVSTAPPTAVLPQNR
jgi:hypothetical protein